MTRLFLAFLSVLIFAGCAAGNATIHYGDPKNPDRVTSVSGLKSRDAANMANNAAYYKAQVDKPQNAIVSIKAQPGQKVTIDGLQEFTVWAPSSDEDRLAAPTLAPTEFSENVRAVGDATSKVLRAATPIVGIQEGAATVRNGQNTALESQRITADSNASIATQGLEAATQPPYIVGPEAGLRLLSPN